MWVNKAFKTGRSTGVKTTGITVTRLPWPPHLGSQTRRHSEAQKEEEEARAFAPNWRKQWKYTRLGDPQNYRWRWMVVVGEGYEIQITRLRVHKGETSLTVDEVVIVACLASV